MAIGAGMLILLAGDIVFVREIADGTYVPSTLLDASWAAGTLVLALGAVLGTSLDDVSALRGRSLYVAIVLSFGVSFGLLIEETLSDRNPVVIVLAALVPCLILVRLIATVRENGRLARDNEGIISAAGEGIYRTDLASRIAYMNPAALRMLGYSMPEVLGRSSHNLFHHTRPNGAPYPLAECPAARTLADGATHRVSDEVFWRKDGSPMPVDYTTAPARERGRVTGMVVVFDDVTHQRQMKEQLRHQADHDSLTGLFNRRRFGEEVSGQLSYAQRYSRPGVLLLLDIDSFKFVNDSYGHPVGDRLLCDVGAILGATVRETDVVARIGGDEFAVLLREATEEEGLEVARGLAAAVRAKSQPTVGASVGVAPFDGAGEKTPDELLVAADVALYEAKEAGGGAAIYSGKRQGPDLGGTDPRRPRRGTDRRRRPADSRPRVGRVSSEELLVRMIDPHGDKVPPAAFLPSAERFGLINEIDLVVLAKAIELVAQGRPVATNVSALTLTDPRYIEALKGGIAAGADPALFNFEITETAAVANMADAQEFARRHPRARLQPRA